MADEFFKEEPVAEEPQAPEKIKLGNEEFAQEELQKLVGLGKLAEEYESKYNRPISQYYPEYTKSQQKLKELEDQLAEAKAPKPNQVELSPEQLKVQARQQAKELGILTVDEVNTYIDQRLAGVKIMDKIDGLIKTTQEIGKPVPTRQQILDHMQDEGYRDPEKAYKDLFENELKNWELNQAKKMKPPTFDTQTSSTAGAKTPPEPTSLNKNNLGERLRAVLGRDGSG